MSKKLFRKDLKPGDVFYYKESPSHQYVVPGGAAYPGAMVSLLPDWEAEVEVVVGPSKGVTRSKKGYVIGSLRNPQIPVVAEALRDLGYEIFDDWYAAGPEADDYWQKYETARGHDYIQAIQGKAAENAFEFDLKHLEQSDFAIMVLPAGKSAHMELGFIIGRGKTPYVILPDPLPERYDLMYRFVYKFGGRVFRNLDEATKHLGGLT